ncbi:MAG: (2Fe-2S)-binding protein [Deltaproteobacteria bacterium]|nr:MAG: (2Fe-2S)-binding protein [Deltaproteobacteria bacterium]
MKINLLVNGALTLADAAPGLLALDWLREHRRLCGTKEGCKEGDCGACAIMLATSEPDGGVRVRPVTSCLVPFGELHGRGLITIEGLNVPGELNPAQRAMVEEGGAQCGFCTPGFIVSLCWYILYSTDPEPSLAGFRDAISGNLCRCTGYGSIFRAAERVVARFAAGGDLEGVWQAPDRVAALVERGAFPAWLAELPQRLTELRVGLEPAKPRSSEAGAPPIAIAGGTDLYVQRGEELPHVSVQMLNHRPSWSYIEVDEERVRIGGVTTFQDFAEHPEIQRMLPSILDTMELIASLPIRHRATLAGNLINASPIGDMTAYLLALGAQITLVDPQGQRREMPLEDLYLGYKTLDKRAEELVGQIAFPVVGADDHVAFEKVSKRRCLDIATVNAAVRVRLSSDGHTVQAARLAVGGVAPIPLLLREASAVMVGRRLDPNLLHQVLQAADGEVAPISDVRGSAAYKRLLARQLLLSALTDLFPRQLPLDEALGLVAPAGAAIGGRP